VHVGLGGEPSDGGLHIRHVCRGTFLATVAAGSNKAVEGLIEDLQRVGGGVAAPAKSSLAVGKWRLHWTKQVRRKLPASNLLPIKCSALHLHWLTC
jgi:hypothetical protein